MKKITPSGQSLVVVKNGFGWSRPVDSFPSHAASGFLFTFVSGVSGTIYLMSLWTLKDGSNYYYVSGISPSNDQALVEVDWENYYDFRTGITGAPGFFYNYNFRARATDKFNVVDFEDWYFSH